MLPIVLARRGGRDSWDAACDASGLEKKKKVKKKKRQEASFRRMLQAGDGRNLERKEFQAHIPYMQDPSQTDPVTRTGSV